MKILVWSDMQFHPWPEFSTTLSNGLNSRFQDQLNVQKEIFLYAEELKKKTKEDVIIVHTGDLFETMTEKIDKVTFLTVYEAFSEFSESGIPVILLIGNHDFVDKTETIHILEPFKKIPNVLVVDKPIIQTVEGVGLFFIPYTKQDFLRKIRNFVSSDCLYKPKYLFTHQGVNGAKVGPRDIPLKEEFSPNDFRIDWFTLVFNGHYHKHQVYVNSLWIVGSPLQKDFGERNDKKGFLVLDTETPRKPVFVPTKAPKFFKIEVGKDFNIPEDFKTGDFLWIIASEMSHSKVTEILNGSGVNLENVRIEIAKQEVRTSRTSISVSDPTEEQLEKYLKYFETDLDKSVLLQRAVSIYKEAKSEDLR